MQMSAKKIAISLSPGALKAVDRYAKAEGISRSAWFERAAQRARRREATQRAVRQISDEGMTPATEGSLEALRREVGAG